jgi:hypothetical protein
VGNSGNFVETTPLIWRNTPSDELSPFESFLNFSDWLHARVGRTSSIALVRLMELMFQFLVDERKLDRRMIAPVLWRDYCRGGRHDKPSFLKDLLPGNETASQPRVRSTGLKRQARHVA